MGGQYYSAALISQSAAERQGGFYEYKPMYVSPLAIPKTNSTQQSAITKLVDHIISAKARDALAVVSEWEDEIDELVYELYELTEDEIALVKRATV